MELWQYILVSLISAFGLAVGLIAGRIAEEELKPGKKYFVLAQNFILALILFVLLFFYKIDAIISIVLAAVFLFLLIKLKELKNNYLIYALLGGVFFISSKNESFIYQSSLIFLYGFPTAALAYKKKHKALLLQAIIFVISAFLLFATLPQIL